MTPEDSERRAVSQESGELTPQQTQERPSLRLYDLYNQIDKDRERVAARILSNANRIRETVADVAPRLAEIDLDVFKDVTVVDSNGIYSTMKLLEVPGSGRRSGLPFESSYHRFYALVTYITTEGILIDFSATRRQRGKRVIFGDNSFRETQPVTVVKFQEGIFKALAQAASKGYSDSKNHRLTPS